MHSVDLTYTDYNDITRTEKFYFNLDKLEILEMEIDFEGGLEAHIKKLQETSAAKEAYHLFKDIVMKAYGRKSDDGRRFEKSEEITRQFEQSPALGELIFGFLDGSIDAAKFVENLLPAAAVQQAQQDAARQRAENGQPNPDPRVVPGTVVAPEAPVAPPAEEPRRSYSRRELLDMSQDEFDAVAGKDPRAMTHDLLVVAMERKSNAGSPATS